MSTAITIHSYGKQYDMIIKKTNEHNMLIKHLKDVLYKKVYDKKSHLLNSQIANN